MKEKAIVIYFKIFFGEECVSYFESNNVENI